MSAGEPHVVVTITPNGNIRGVAIDDTDISGYIFDASTRLSPRTEATMIDVTLLVDKIVIKEGT